MDFTAAAVAHQVLTAAVAVVVMEEAMDFSSILPQHPHKVPAAAVVMVAAAAVAILISPIQEYPPAVVDLAAVAAAATPDSIMDLALAAVGAAAAVVALTMIQHKVAMVALLPELVV